MGLFWSKAKKEEVRQEPPIPAYKRKIDSEGNNGVKIVLLGEEGIINTKHVVDSYAKYLDPDMPDYSVHDSRFPFFSAKHNNVQFSLEIRTPPCNDSSDRLRPLEYKGTEVFVLFCPVGDTRQHAARDGERLEKWMGEINHFRRSDKLNAFVLLVGVNDKRDQNSSSVKEWEENARKLGADKYLEFSFSDKEDISKLDNNKVATLFEAIMSSVLEFSEEPKPQSGPK